MAIATTIDFHVTSECSQECAYCWGPQEIEPVDTPTAIRIISAIARHGARRIVFTGGDPLKRSDIAELVLHARSKGLEVAVSTTGDELTEAFLRQGAGAIDLISLPLDGPNEEVSSRTKKPGHFDAVMKALDLLARYPEIDIKIATPVTRHNLTAVTEIAALLDRRAERIPNRLFFNVFQAFPRSMAADVDWASLVVSDEEFAQLRADVSAQPHSYRINWLDHDTLDRLYLMVFPDGTLTIPTGTTFVHYGPFLDIDDLEALVANTDFDAKKHRRHSLGWSRTS